MFCSAPCALVPDLRIKSQTVVTIEDRKQQAM